MSSFRSGSFIFQLGNQGLGSSPHLRPALRCCQYREIVKCYPVISVAYFINQSGEKKDISCLLADRAPISCPALTAGYKSGQEPQRDMSLCQVARLLACEGSRGEGSTLYSGMIIFLLNEDSAHIKMMGFGSEEMSEYHSPQAPSIYLHLGSTTIGTGFLPCARMRNSGLGALDSSDSEVVPRGLGKIVQAFSELQRCMAALYVRAQVNFAGYSLSMMSSFPRLSTF